jgi:hypothetical protein
MWLDLHSLGYCNLWMGDWCPDISREHSGFTANGWLFFIGCLLAEDETIHCLETSGNTHPVMHYIIPEEWITKLHCCKSLKTWERWCFCTARTIVAVMIMMLALKAFNNVVFECVGAHGSAVGQGTTLQVGRSLVRFPMVSLEFFIDIILPAALWPWGWLNL